MTLTVQQENVLRQIEQLIRESGLTRNDILKMLDARAPVSNEREDDHAPSMLQKMISYIGGSFVFAGVCVYIGMSWEDLDSLSRVIITLGSGFVAFVLGLLAIGDPRFVRASTPLFLMAAGLEPLGLFVFMDEYLPPSGQISLAAAFVFGFMTIQQSVAFFATRRSSLLFFTIFFFYLLLSALMDMAEVDAPLTVMALGLSGVMVTWAVSRSEHHAITPFFYFLSGLAITAASFDYFANTPYDVFLIGVVALMIFVSVRAYSRTFLTVSIIALLCFLGYYTDEYFKDVVGWPIALVVTGLIMLGVSSFALKLARKMK